MQLFGTLADKEVGTGLVLVFLPFRPNVLTNQLGQIGTERDFSVLSSLACDPECVSEVVDVR